MARKVIKPFEPVVGKTCYLRSGSPRMTVIELLDGSRSVKTTRVKVAWCKYDSGEMQQAELPVEALQDSW